MDDMLDTGDFTNVKNLYSYSPVCGAEQEQEQEYI